MQQHIVQYQIFDVAFTDAGKSYELQNKISDIFHSKLMDGMEQLFNRLVPDDILLTLGDIDINIGDISYNLIEYDLTGRILDELEREINYRLALIPSKNENDGQQLKKIESGYVKLLEYFLLTGAMPWWANGELNDPVTIIENLIIKDAAVVRQLILNVGRYSYVRQRLVYQFSEKVIRNVIAVLEPAHAEFIFAYHISVVNTHRQEKLIDGAANTEFDRALWLFVLTYILSERGSIFNQKIFVRSTLTQMASHYNISYVQILALLSKALEQYTLTDVQNSNLTLIISELSVDEFDNRQLSAINRLNPGDPSTEIIQQNIELIRYFLIFGSLPWWSEPHSESGLENIILDLIKVVPKAFSKLILAIGQNEEVRKRITTVFNDAAIIPIVKLLESDNATFIINYVAEVQIIHTKKPVIYTDGKDFKKAVWKFIFDYLLTERGSVFNERMFLESNIRKLANTYNVQYTDMLLYLVQSVGQMHQASIEHAPLFQLLAGLLNDLNQQTTQLMQPINTILNVNTGATRTVVLKDVLLHWLTYGNIPWWGSKYFEQGPTAMFQSLFNAAPAEAFLLLKYAGTMPHVRKRTIYQIPEQLIVSILRKQPGGESAVKLYEYMLQAFNKVNNIVNFSAPSNILLLIFWEEYIAGEYKTFDNVSFIKRSVDSLIRQKNINHKQLDQNDIYYPAIIEELKNIFETANEITYLRNLNIVVLNTDTADLILEEPYNTEIDVQRSLIHYLSTKAPNQQAIINEVLLILKNFLENNKLPQQFKGTNPAYIKGVIGQLLQLLKKDDNKAYNQLLLNSEELKGYVKDVPDTATLINGSIEELISNYLQQGNHPQKENILNKAFDILEHFLSTGKLPEPFAGADAMQVLKQLLLLLNYELPARLKNILLHDNHFVYSRMLLHNIFATTSNTAEANINHTLKEYLERDIVKYLEQQPDFIFNSDETIAVILNRYIKQSVDEPSLIKPLLKNKAVARYITRYFNDAQVNSLLNNSVALIGGSENLIWINDLQLLVNNNIPDTLQRERLITLLREFNLLILGKHIAINSFVAYLKQLLNFISSANHSLFTALSNVMLKVGSNSGLSPVFTAKLSQVLTELHIYDAGYKTGQRIKQQLIRASDNALQNATGANADKKNIEAKQLKEEIKQNLQITEEKMKDENKQLLINSKDTIYINNAGLVLLNPFLATYFVRLNMMEGGKFINADAQLRAVHLLQYLVNGKSNNPEHFLVLNKIFCNVPVEEPVMAEIILTDIEKEMSQQLLKAVLNSWNKLKNTSIIGLQESFLQRDGALTFKEDAWHLTVEQRGYDVLLQTLPWAIGMIKTPWMDNFLYVEWT